MNQVGAAEVMTAPKSQGEMPPLGKMAKAVQGLAWKILPRFPNRVWVDSDVIHARILWDVSRPMQGSSCRA